MNRRNYYRLLQVQPDAPLEIIRASYRTLMNELKQHPDLGGEHYNAVLLNQAYATLSNAEKRAEYDRQLYEHYTKRPFVDPEPNKKPLITVFCPFCKRPLAYKPRAEDACPTCDSPLRSQGEGSVIHACRRSVARIRKSGQIRYYSFWPQKGKVAEMVDLSPKGVRFVCSEQLRPNLIIKITSPLLKSVAKVRECHKQLTEEETSYTTGVEFITVTFSTPKGSFVSKSA